MNVNTINSQLGYIYGELHSAIDSGTSDAEETVTAILETIETESASVKQKLDDRRKSA